MVRKQIVELHSFQMPIGTGQYTFVDWKPANVKVNSTVTGGVTMGSGGTAFVPGVWFQPVTFAITEGLLVAMMLSGEADIMMGVTEVQRSLVSQGLFDKWFA